MTTPRPRSEPMTGMEARDDDREALVADARKVAGSIIADASNYPLSVVPHVVSRDMGGLIAAVAEAFIEAGYRKHPDPEIKAMSRSRSIEERVAEIVAESQTAGSSANPLVQIAWLIHGLDLWHRTGGRMGHTLTETVEYVTSFILRNRDDYPSVMSPDANIAELADRIAEVASRITPSWRDVLAAWEAQEERK